MRSTHRLRLEYLLGGVVQYRAGESLGPRLLPDFEMVLIIEGNARYVADGREYAAPAGSLLFTRPGFQELYHWDPARPTRHAYFHFGISVAPAAWPPFSQWPLIRTRPDPVLTALFRHIVNRIYLHNDWPAAPPGAADCLIVETLLTLFLEEPGVERIDFERDRPPQLHRAINLMREMIDTDAHRHLSLSDLARAGGVSEKHLCRSFRMKLGHSPVATYRLLRLQLSLSLLARSNLTIREVADRCGFDDAAYFSRCFFKAFGSSPSAVREDLRKGALPPANPLPVDLTPRLFW